MEIFKSTSLFKFQEQFSNEKDCKTYLYNHKWKDNFVCNKCGNNESWNNSPETGKTCTKCRKIHSTTSDTIFHGVRFPLLKAFYIIYDMTTTTKSLSALQVARKYDINRKTAWLFMRKIRESMASSGDYPIKNDNSDTKGTDSLIYIDEFFVGGYESGKVGKSKSKKRLMSIVVEATTKNKIKRVYTTKIQGNKESDVRKIFDTFIEKGSTVITDGNPSYTKPLNNDYVLDERIEWMKSAQNPLNRMVQQIKSWLRGVYHKSTHQHIQAYLNAFSFRINRSQWKEVRFHSAIMKALNHPPITKKMIPNVNTFV